MIEPIKTKQDIEEMKIVIKKHYPNATTNPLFYWYQAITIL